MPVQLESSKLGRAMPVTQNTPAPYAGSATVVGLIERHRQKGLPVPINSEVLARSGVSESLIPRTLYAMQVTDLIDEQGRPTPAFEAMRLAPEAEYRPRMAEWLSAAYADALKFIDPATADETQVRDAFRAYSPTGQQDRMVSLFMGLFEAAGIMPERKRQRAKSAPKNGEPVRRPKSVSSKEPPVDPRPAHTPSLPSDHDHGKHSRNIVTQLLEKFPPFDPTWAPEIQAKWFEGYERLLSMGSK